MRTDYHKHPYFHEYTHMSPALVFGLIIVTLGFYMIPWIYTKNKEFATIDEHAPHENRGVVILMLLPFAWGYLFYVVKNLLFYHPILITLEFFGWSFIIFLILKYIWDFIQSFARVTESDGRIWFLIFLIPFVAIPLMQSEINAHFQRIHIQRKYHQLYK